MTGTRVSIVDPATTYTLANLTALANLQLNVLRLRNPLRSRQRRQQKRSPQKKLLPKRLPLKNRPAAAAPLKASLVMELGSILDWARVESPTMIMT